VVSWYGWLVHCIRSYCGSGVLGPVFVFELTLGKIIQGPFARFTERQRFPESPKGCGIGCGQDRGAEQCSLIIRKYAAMALKPQVLTCMRVIGMIPQ